MRQRKSFSFVSWCDESGRQFRYFRNLKQIARFWSGHNYREMVGEVWYLAPSKQRKKKKRSWIVRYELIKGKGQTNDTTTV